jgi:hypothetical protein
MIVRFLWDYFPPFLLLFIIIDRLEETRDQTDGKHNLFQIANPIYVDASCVAYAVTIRLG